jgi:hypothetical protein
MRRHVKLYMPRKDGTSMFDHISSAVGQGTAWPDEYPLPEIPDEVQHIWHWYWEIRQGIPAGMSGSEPISHTELAAWAQMARVDVGPALLQQLRSLDVTYLNSVSKAKPKK